MLINIHRPAVSYYRTKGKEVEFLHGIRCNLDQQIQIYAIACILRRTLRVEKIYS